MAADIIPFPDPDIQARDPMRQKQGKLVDCLFGDVDLFRLLRDTEKKIVSLRQKREKDAEVDP